MPEREESPDRSVSEEKIQRIAAAYFNPSLCPESRPGFEAGQFPFRQYKDKAFFPRSDTQFAPIPGQRLDVQDVGIDSWLRLSTQSGSTYTLHLVDEPTRDSELIVIGSRIDESSNQELLAGLLELPALQSPAHFLEFANFPANRPLALYLVRYPSPDDLQRQIEAQIRVLFAEQGDAWMHSSRPGIIVSPSGLDLKSITTTPVTAIEVGLPNDAVMDRR